VPSLAHFENLITLGRKALPVGSFQLLYLDRVIVESLEWSAGLQTGCSAGVHARVCSGSSPNHTAQHQELVEKTGFCVGVRLQSCHKGGKIKAGFTDCEISHSGLQEVSGYDFSRSVNATKQTLVFSP
jgi:hypothetical protein